MCDVKTGDMLSLNQFGRPRVAHAIIIPAFQNNYVW